MNMMDVKSISVRVDGTEIQARAGATILDILNENGIEYPQICHVPEVDPIQTCDTCIVEANGKLVRSCATVAENGMSIDLSGNRVKEAQTEAMDRLLENHLLYCTVCDNNNGNCTLHNTAEMMGIEHQNTHTRQKKILLARLICLILFTAMIQTNVLPAASVLRSVKTFR